MQSQIDLAALEHRDKLNQCLFELSKGQKINPYDSHFDGFDKDLKNIAKKHSLFSQVPGFEATKNSSMRGDSTLDINS